MSSSLVHFSPFRPDPANERLWDETHEIPLRRKTFAVLRYLVEHPEQLVTKEALMDAVWPGTVVGDDALTGCVRDLRKVLGDEAKTPHYIETVHGRGYRFIGKVVNSQYPAGSSQEVVSSQYSVASREEQSTNGQEIDAVMPALRPSSGQAPAGIQESQAQAASEPPWIPASAGMTPPPLTPQNYTP